MDHFDEYNTDVVGQSFYLEPDPPIGRFSKAFFLPLAREFVARRKSLKAVTEHGSHVGAIGGAAGSQPAAGLGSQSDAATGVAPKAINPMPLGGLQ